MSILALDISKSRTGWAYWSEGSERAQVGHWVLGSEFTTDGQACQKLHAKLAEHHMVMPFDHLFIEQPLTQLQRGGNSNQHSDILVKLVAHAESFAAAYALRTCQLIAINSWRADFIGPQKRGTKRATLKDLTVERCRQFGFRPRNDDEADAIGILTYGIILRGLLCPWVAGETLRPMLSMGGGR